MHDLAGATVDFREAGGQKVEQERQHLPLRRLSSMLGGENGLAMRRFEPLLLGQIGFQMAIDVDRHLEAYLAEKERLEAAHGESIFAAEHGTEPAQREVLSLLLDLLPARFPEIYRRAGEIVHVGKAGRRVDLAKTGEPPLKIAARLVQEDLVLMRRGENGWRLAAASLSFPSSWSLAEKFGKPLRDIHRPVPQFGPGTRSDDLIERMFDKLQGQAVVRYNWSLQPDPDLYKPLSS